MVSETLCSGIRAKIAVHPEEELHDARHHGETLQDVKRQEIVTHQEEIRQEEIRQDGVHQEE
ncbi:hypothetical protein ACIQXV_12525 [Neobacillus sp. NPDC097160]|uniref:hypothetical protein n=1 Tax=Neobacillus sp. NPDC097160 TaxID=3364298 RepID=UPI00382294C1